MSFNDLDIDDLEDIPDRYSVSWKFLNAFFKAFQERADYIEYAQRAETYEDLILDNAQIATTELQSRLASFNGKVLSCFDNTFWIKDSSWSELNSLSYERVGESTSGRQTISEGLGIIDFEYWEEEDLRDLLTDDGYDLVFDYTYRSSFTPLYWSSLYILLKYVMKYRKMSLRYAPEPNPTEPYLVINDRFTGIGFSQDSGEDATDANGLFNEAIGKSRGEGKRTYDDGNNVLWRCLVGSESISRAVNFQGFEGVVYNNSASVEVSGLTSDPFCAVPANMNIQVLLDRGRGTQDTKRDEIDQPASPTQTPLQYKWDLDANDENEIKGFKSTRTITGGWEGDIREPKITETEYTPDQNSYGLSYGENPKYGTAHQGGKCKLLLPDYKDFRTDNDFGDLQAEALQPPFFATSLVNEVAKKRGASSFYRLNFAACELPQSQFEFR